MFGSDCSRFRRDGGRDLLSRRERDPSALFVTCGQAGGLRLLADNARLDRLDLVSSACARRLDVRRREPDFRLTEDFSPAGALPRLMGQLHFVWTRYFEVGDFRHVRRVPQGTENAWHRDQTSALRATPICLDV